MNNKLVCIAGKNEISVFGLKLLIDKLGKESVVVCPNESLFKPHWQPSLARYAKHHGVPVLSLEELYDIKNLIFISLEFDKIIDPEKFLSKELFNIHFSLLPAYKGVYTSFWPILNGEKRSGVTIHKIEKGIDTGDILSQKSFELSSNITCRELYLKYMDIGKKLLRKELESILSGKYETFRQSDKNSSYYSLKSFDFSNTQIDLNQTADNILRQCRALTFKEYQLPKINNCEVAVGSCTNVKSKKRPGTITNKRDSFILSTIDYDVELYFDISMKIFDFIAEESNSNLSDIASEKTFDINVTNAQGWSALMQAAFIGNIPFMNQLVQLGADLNQQNCNGTSPLMYAASYAEKSNDIEPFEFLVINGANLKQKDHFGLNVLEYAKKNQNSKVIDFHRNYSD